MTLIDELKELLETHDIMDILQSLAEIAGQQHIRQHEHRIWFIISQALNDLADKTEYMGEEHKKGFRFISDVEFLNKE